MGDRYFVTITCPDCGTKEDEVYYAPTCGFTTWECPGCKRIVDMGEQTGITYEEASNRAEIEQAVKDAQDKIKNKGLQ